MRPRAGCAQPAYFHGKHENSTTAAKSGMRTMPPANRALAKAFHAENPCTSPRHFRTATTDHTAATNSIPVSTQNMAVRKQLASIVGVSAVKASFPKRRSSGAQSAMPQIVSTPPRAMAARMSRRSPRPPIHLPVHRSSAPARYKDRSPPIGPKRTARESIDPREEDRRRTAWTPCREPSLCRGPQQEAGHSDPGRCRRSAGSFDAGEATWKPRGCCLSSWHAPYSSSWPAEKPALRRLCIVTADASGERPRMY
jgi:hypothetical protein